MTCTTCDAQGWVLTRLRDAELDLKCPLCGATVLDKIRTRDDVPFKQGMTLYDVKWYSGLDDETPKLVIIRDATVATGEDAVYKDEPWVRRYGPKVSELYGIRRNAVTELIAAWQSLADTYESDAERCREQIEKLNSEQ